MRKPRDYDAELKALDARARELRTRKQSQLGELVIATGADELAIEELAGALLAAAATTTTATKEAWRQRGAAFFQGKQRAAGSAGNVGELPLGATQNDRRAASAPAAPGAS